jgi:hypothetical protein
LSVFHSSRPSGLWKPKPDRHLLSALCRRAQSALPRSDASRSARSIAPPTPPPLRACSPLLPARSAWSRRRANYSGSAFCSACRVWFIARPCFPEKQRTPSLDTLLQNVTRLCAQLVAAGCLPCFTAYPDWSSGGHAGSDAGQISAVAFVSGASFDFGEIPRGVVSIAEQKLYPRRGPAAGAAVPAPRSHTKTGARSSKCGRCGCRSRTGASWSMKRIVVSNRLTDLLKRIFRGSWGGSRTCVRRWWEICRSNGQRLRTLQKAMPRALQRFFQQHNCPDGERTQQRIEQIRTAIPAT